jgi:hypothetical protein
VPAKWPGNGPDATGLAGVTTMAKGKNILTFNGAPIESSAWEKITLGTTPDTMILKEHYDTLQEARKAFEQELLKAIKARIKINDAKHEVRLGFRFGPSYVVCDKTGNGGRTTTKGLAL